MLAYAREDQKLDINLEKESEKDAVSLTFGFSFFFFGLVLLHRWLTDYFLSMRNTALHQY